MKGTFVNRIFHSIFEGYLCESNISLYIWRLPVWIGYFTLYLKVTCVNRIFHSIFEGYLCESDISLYIWRLPVWIGYFTLYLKGTCVNRIFHSIFEGSLEIAPAHILLTRQKLLLNTPLEIELDPFSRFGGYYRQTNKQTDNKSINILIDWLNQFNG